MFYVDVSTEEAVRRVTGKKLDPTTQEVYTPDNLPTDNKIVMDRLVDVEDPENTKEKVAARSDAFRQNLQQLKGWFSLFGNEQEKMSAFC